MQHYKVFDERITRPLVMGNILPEIDLLLQKHTLKSYSYRTAWKLRIIIIRDEVNISCNMELATCIE